MTLPAGAPASSPEIEGRSHASRHSYDIAAATSGERDEWYAALCRAAAPALMQPMAAATAAATAAPLTTTPLWKAPTSRVDGADFTGGTDVPTPARAACAVQVSIPRYHHASAGSHIEYIIDVFAEVCTHPFVAGHSARPAGFYLRVLCGDCAEPGAAGKWGASRPDKPIRSMCRRRAPPCQAVPSPTATRTSESCTPH